MRTHLLFRLRDSDRKREGKREEGEGKRQGGIGQVLPLQVGY